MALYSVEIRDQFGRIVQTLARPLSKQFTLMRNRAGSCTFQLDLYDPQATPNFLKINQYDVVFKRNGLVVFVGQLTYVHPLIDGDNKTVEIIASGYFDLFDFRTITPDFPNFDPVQEKLPFTSEDTGHIAWDLIRESQFPNSNDGLFNVNGTNSAYQLFVPISQKDATDLKLLIQNVSISGGTKMNVGIYDAQTGILVPNSNKSILCSFVSSTLGWYDIPYDSPRPFLDSTKSYYVKVSLDTVQSGSNGLYWAYLNNDWYPNGHAVSPELPSFFTPTQDLQFFVMQEDNTYAMTKNTYLGIQLANIDTSFNLSPVYDVYKTIKTAITDLSDTLNGIDFNFTVSIDNSTNIMRRYFNVYYPKQGVDHTNLNFSYPGNIKKIERPKDGKPMSNNIIGRGQGQGATQLIETTFDQSSVSSYSQRIKIENDPDVSDGPTLSSLIGETLRLSKDPLDIPNMVIDGNQPPSFGTYGIGDQIKINVRGAPMLDFTSIYRIEKLTVAVTDDDQEEITFTVSIA